METRGIITKTKQKTKPSETDLGLTTQSLFKI